MTGGRPKRRKPGRPRKYGEGRINATVRFTPETYAELKAAADQNRRSVSEEVEARVERARQYDQTLEALRTDLQKIKDGRPEAAFREVGHTPVHTPYGKIWVPKDYPLKQVSGFIPPEEDKQ
jgi:hypothetical protein